MANFTLQYIPNSDYSSSLEIVEELGMDLNETLGKLAVKFRREYEDHWTPQHHASYAIAVGMAYEAFALARFLGPDIRLRNTVQFGSGNVTVSVND